MKRIVTLILALVMTVSATAGVAVFAEDGKLPFADVEEGKWYYDGVSWCYENKYMKGDPDGLFLPDGGMTRAMTVTVLAAVAGVDLKSPEYAESGFVDAPAGRWFSRAVAWAAKNGVTAGTGKGVFSPDAALTREQFVTMLRRLMKYMGVDVGYKGGHAFDAFGDASDSSGWAEAALRWAAENELITGVGKENGVPSLLPGGAVTRAQAAVLLKAAFEKNVGGEYPVGSVTLGGVDISEFAIIYGSDFDTFLREKNKETAEFLAAAIKNACGVELEVYKDSERAAVPGAHEILIGLTDREEQGLVTIDRGDLVDPSYVYELRGNYLIFTSPINQVGTAYGVVRFLEEYCGVSYYSNGFYGYRSIKSSSVPDGIRASEASCFENVSNGTKDGDNQFIGTSSGDDMVLNLSHSLPVLVCPGCDAGTVPDYTHHLRHYLSHDPCLTDPDSIDTIIKNVRYILQNKLGDNKEKAAMVHVSQSDHAVYCTCDHCRDFYRLWGRSATYVQIMKYVSEEFGDEYPNVQFIAYGCDHSEKRPRLASEISDEDYNKYLEKYGDEKYIPDKDLTPPDNCVLLLKSDIACESHNMTDPDCPRNVNYVKNVEGWCELYSNIYFNNFTCSKSYIHNLFPDIYNLIDTYEFFAGYPNYKGYRTYGFAHEGSDFIGLRTFLIARVTWNTDMEWDEYSDLIDSFLKSAYGPGWTYVREFIDKTEELSSENHFWTYSGVGDEWELVIRPDQWAENYDYCASLFDRALSLCDTPEQTFALRRSYIPLKYIKCQMAYLAYENSGSDEDLAEFSRISSDYYNELIELDLEAPENWSETLDPDQWIRS